MIIIHNVCKGFIMEGGASKITIITCCRDLLNPIYPNFYITKCNQVIKSNGSAPRGCQCYLKIWVRYEKSSILQIYSGEIGLGGVVESDTCSIDHFLMFALFHK